MSSVLETFFYAFKANTDNVVSGVDKIEREVAHADTELKQFGNTILKTLGGLSIGLGVFEAFQSIKAHIAETADEMNRMVEASESLGMDVGELDAWSKSIEDAGGSAESFQGTLKGLAADLAMVQTKGTSRKMAFFEELGINYKAVKSTTELLPLLADQFSKLSEEEALGFGTKMGIDEKTIAVLRKGRAEVEMMIDRQEKLGVITKEDKEKIAAYDNAMDELGRVFQNIWRTITVMVVPALTEIGEAFTDMFLWLKDNEGTAKAFGITFAVVVGGVMLSAVYSFISGLTLMSVMGMIATAATVGSFLLIGAAIAAVGAALFFLIDDFIAWQEGGESVIGDMIGSWEDFESKLFEIFDSIGEYWDRVIENIVAGMEKVTGLWADMKGGASALWGDVTGVLNVGSDQVGAADASPFNGSPSSTNKTNNTTVEVGQVTVNTQATDAPAVAGSLGSELTNQLKEAVAGFDDGVDA